MTAAGASVCTIGIEEEYQIVDAETGDLRSRARDVLPAARDEGGDEVQAELYQSQIEIASRVCTTLGDVRDELVRLRRAVIGAVERDGGRVLAAGTHPFSDWRDQQATPKHRYRQSVLTYEQITRELVIFGCHVHVGMPDRESGLQVLNRARLWLAPILALTGSSPYWLGADTGYATEILDLLREEGIKASFGMTGVWAEANPDLVRRMVAEGHQLINHTWDHSSLTGANTQLPPLSPEQVTQQLADTEAVVRDLTGGYEMRPYFRPPYGDYDAASLEYLYDNGYSQTIWWTCDSRGWAGWGAQEIIDYCTTNITEDEILLLHVGAAAVGDFEALPGLIRFFRESGYDFVTIEQMLQPLHTEARS